jgi:hypothetical protein
MTEPIQEKIRQSLLSANDLYHRLVLLVGQVGSGKSDILRDIAVECGAHVVNVNLELSGMLLELTAKQRALRLPDILNQIAEKAQTPLILDNLEILFDPGLKQDPLRLLQGLSRNRATVAAWNGTFVNGRLIYAEQGHPEYRTYDSVDALVVGIDEDSTVNTVTQ